MSQEVLIDDADGVRVISINRPDARNAVTATVARCIAAAVDELEASDDLAVAVLTGIGGNFCAGMDLKAFIRGESPSIAGRGFGGLTESPPSKPLIAAVEGWALAGGCELALSADLIVASKSAKFGLPEVKRGLVAAAGGLLRLPKAIPYPVAMRVALTGDPLTAEEAATHGLISDLVEDGQALASAVRLARQIASNGPLAVRATKALVAGAVGWTDSQAFENQRALVAPVFASNDAKEGAQAFAEKRPPVWQGR
ncbi:MAG: crotonase/enoyl-CoA hydratase family protein [Hyphomicrobiales bacterium]|jgi:enoyl-CoA hydratase|nr:MAG: crotonase/enoyl-CoA hydratase family protein [Hyphomicrobiales bacterium]